MRRSIALLLLAACTSEAQIVEEMEGALRTSQAAVAAQLVATELLAHTFDEPSTTPTTTGLRHGEDCGCPCVDRMGESPPFVVTLDYPGTGCVPDTRLVPSTLSGHAVIEFDGAEVSVTFDGLTLGRDHAVTGRLSGTPAADGQVFDASASLALGEVAVDLDTTTLLEADYGLTIDGLAQIGEASLTFDALDLPWDEIPPPCPSPVGGHTVVDASVDLDVDYGTPGGGLVTVTRRRRVSENVDYCSYRTDLF